MPPRSTIPPAFAPVRARYAVAIALLLGLSLALLRLIPAKWQDLLPACPIHRYLHILCPGCGGTRALLSLLHGDLRSAWHANSLLTALLPFAAIYAAAALRRIHRPAPAPWPRIPSSALLALYVVAAAFTIFRNLIA